MSVEIINYFKCECGTTWRESSDLHDQKVFCLKCGRSTETAIAYDSISVSQARKDDTDPPFWCLDEGDGKPRCAVQCPFCEKGL